jgi:tRNA A58 N-methylase Trm61
VKAYALAAAALTLIACQAPVTTPEAQAQAAKPAAPAAKRTPDVIYVPTPHETVDAMLALGEVKKGDVLYDLGSGDGRIPIAAAKKFGVRGVGIDINPERIEEANANAKAAGVTHLVTFRNEDLFQADFRDATVVTLYLLTTLNEKLRPKLLAELKPGTRIVSHSFDMGDWEPEKTVNVPNGSQIFLWRVPAKTAP